MVVHDVLLLELSAILVKTVGNKYRDVIKPRVSGCCTKQDPIILLSDFIETLGPRSRSNKPLLIEDEKSRLHIFVLSDVVPGVDCKYTMKGSITSSPHTKVH